MEIERKFLVKNMPNLSGIEPVHFERYYLSLSNDTEERIQKTNDEYSHEKKTAVDKLSRSTERRELTKDEFERLRAKSTKAIIRESYALSPKISVKIYHGNYEGLVRAEVEFSSIEEAGAYIPGPWMGKEISDSPLGRDSRLLGLDDDSFKKLLAGYS